MNREAILIACVICALVLASYLGFCWVRSEQRVQVLEKALIRACQHNRSNIWGTCKWCGKEQLFEGGKEFRCEDCRNKFQPWDVP